MPINVAKVPVKGTYRLVSLWELPVITKYERWRKVVVIPKVSAAARRRPEWIIYCQGHGRGMLF